MIRSDNVKIPDVDGILPDNINIRNRRYGYTAVVYGGKDPDKNSVAY